jgi:hypothetical protein
VNESQLFQKVVARRGHPQGRLSIHGLSAMPDGGSPTKNTAVSQARLSAKWLREGKKVLACWYNITKFT